MRITGQSAFIASAILASRVRPAFAQKATGQDLTQRDVEVDVPVKHVILGESRQIDLLAALDKNNPFDHVAGCRDDLPKADPKTYQAFLAKDPGVATYRPSAA